jgi:hypothetical protein
MAHLMQQLAEAEGHCCVLTQYNYFLAQGMTDREVAVHLGVTMRTVRSWRKRRREGTLRCKELLTCQQLNAD